MRGAQCAGKVRYIREISWQHAQIIGRETQGNTHQACVAADPDLHVAARKNIVNTKQYVLLPHELFATLYEHHHHQFITHLCGGGVQNITEFWQAMSSHPGYQSHPVRARSDHQTRCVPISIHGDGVSISGVGRSWAKSVDVYSWSSMLSNTSTKLSNYLIYILYWKLVSPNEHFNGFQKFLRLLTWSLYWLMLGRWPSRDAYDRPINSPKAGKQLAGGFYAVLWTLKSRPRAYGENIRLPLPCQCPAVRIV